MSLHLEFEPHSWYKGAAIKSNAGTLNTLNGASLWEAVYLNGNTGYIVDFEADTLRELKENITKYINHIRERDTENRRRLGEKTNV